jgi:hypothetical protein
MDDRIARVVGAHASEAVTGATVLDVARRHGVRAAGGSDGA